METNSPADTDQSLPLDDAPQAERAEVPATTDAGMEQQAAAMAAVPEPMPELATAREEEPVKGEEAGQEEPAAPAPLEQLNVTEESVAEEAPSPEEAEEGGAEGTGGAESQSVTSGPNGESSGVETEGSSQPAESPRDEAASSGEGVAATAEGTPGAEAAELDPLNALAEQSQRARLSQPDEERATTLLKETLLDGRAGVTRAVAVLPKLPWVIGVSAVSAVWKDMKTAFRTQLLSGLAKNETDAARRMRLSLARGLFKIDVPTALKLAVAVAKEMRDKETGALTPKSAQIFANVLIGRAKPWIAQISLHDLKPAEADLLVHCALVSSFSVPHAPVTQLGVIKWAAEAGRLTKLHDLATESATRGLSRWSAKWQAALRKEVADLPEAFADALKAPAPQEPERRDGAQKPKQEQRPAPAEEAQSEAPKKDAEADDDDEEDEEDEDDDDEEEEDEDEEDDDDEDEDEEEERKARPGGQAGRQDAPKPRPVYESKTIPRKDQPQQGAQQPQQQPQRGQQQGKAFDLRDTLRQIEQHVAGLRSELVSTQNKLRQREQEAQKNKRGPERSAAPIIPGEPTPEELARLNQQLEARNAELQQRILELTQDSEDRAASMGRHGEEPVEQPDAQLRTLLSLKLQEDYEDFAALEKEKPDLVVQQHYRTVLRHVLEVLRNEGVQFQENTRP